MKLFRFCKFQKVIELFKVKLLRLNFVRSAIRFGINYKMWFAIGSFIAIIIPCLIEVNALLATQVGTKLNSSDFVSVKCQGKSFMDARSVNSVGRIPVIEVSEFWNKGTFKLGGSFFELISPNHVFAQEMSSDTANKRPNYAKSSGDICYFEGSKVQFYFYVFLGGSLGIAVGVIIIYLFFKFIIERRW